MLFRAACDASGRIAVVPAVAGWSVDGLCAAVLDNKGLDAEDKEGFA